MSSDLIQRVFPYDRQAIKAVNQLLEQEKIKRDPNLDYTCAIFDESQRVIATGSLFRNSLRCLAVDFRYQGEGLLNKIVSHLISEASDRGDYPLFVYTKISAVPFFESLGFQEIVRVDEDLSFLESQRDGFATYLKHLATSKTTSQNSAAVVINANPFTLGHLYLIEKAASENQALHLFMVSQDSSLIPFTVRRDLILKGTAHLKNICYHETGDYLISQATFPSYFQKDQLAAIKSQAKLDATIFSQIAKQLGITKRYIGEEPSSLVTNHYNQIMLDFLPKVGISVKKYDRLKLPDGRPISASLVRQALKEENHALFSNLLPQTSLDYFLSDEATTIIDKLKATKDLTHY